MKWGLLFSVGGSAVLVSSLLLRVVSYANVLSLTPPYMGPPMSTDALHMTRMWSSPYLLDTVSLATFGVSIILILLGIIIYIRDRTRLPQKVVSEKNDILYPYH